MLIKRTNILFNQELWDQLTRLAKNRNSSIGQLVRTAVEEYYALHDDASEQIRKACQTIETNRKQIKGKLDYKSLINYGRKA